MSSSVRKYRINQLKTLRLLPYIGTPGQMLVRNERKERFSGIG